MCELTSLIAETTYKANTGWLSTSIATPWMINLDDGGLTDKEDTFRCIVKVQRKVI